MIYTITGDAQTTLRVGLWQHIYNEHNAGISATQARKIQPGEHFSHAGSPVRVYVGAPSGVCPCPHCCDDSRRIA